MRFTWWWKVIKQYLSNCNIHGVKYIADDQLTYTERLFWLIACILSWLGCIGTIYYTVQHYIDNPVTITVDTNYLNWQTPFPAVYLCITTSYTIQKYFKRNPGLLGNFSKAEFLTATTEDLLAAYETIRVPCTELLMECMWGKMKFNCCEEFQEIRKSGIGYCLGMNTYHAKKNEKPNVRFYLNQTAKYGDLVIDMNANAKMRKYLMNGFVVFVSSNQYAPIFGEAETHEIHLKPGKRNLLVFTIEHTHNENGVRDIAIERRNCRFHDEIPANSSFDVYSKNTCYLDAFLKYSMDICGCLNFYYYAPPWGRICNGTESLCLISNKNQIAESLTDSRHCFINCEGSAITTHRYEPLDYPNANGTVIRLEISAITHPLVRSRRYVVNSLLDVIVSVGSAVGLFMGASVLSIFEIPYWLFIRRDKIT